MNKDNIDSTESKSNNRVISSNVINPVYLKELDDFIKTLETKRQTIK